MFLLSVLINKMKRKYRLQNIIFSASIVGLILLLFFIVGGYIWKFHGGLSEEHQRWGEFGDFFGAIVGLLAFIGVLYTIRQTKNQEERSIFFQLLGLYKDKVNSIVYSDCRVKNKYKWVMEGEENEVEKEEVSVSGIAAFEKYANKLQKYFVITLLFERMKDVDNEDGLWKAVMDESIEIKLNTILYVLFHHLSVDSFDEFKNEMNKYFEANLKLLSRKIDNDELFLLGIFLITDLEKKGDYKRIYTSMKCVADILYNDNQQYLGQYFRTVYYTLDTIKSFKNWAIDAKIFRSQLSRYELVVLMFNATSSQSTRTTIDLYQEYDIFNNLCLNDFYMDDKIDSKSKSKLINNILNEHISNHHLNY